MTTPTEDARAALADKMRRASRAIYLATDATVADDISAMLTEAVALIEPPAADDREALTRSVGMLLAENDDMEAMDDDAFEIVRDSLVKGLMDLYPAGFRRQVSHPEPVTDARPYSESTDIEYGAWETDDIEEHAHDMLAVVRYRRAALEAARAARIPVPEEGS